MCIRDRDYTGFQADQQGVMEEKAIQGGLLTQAKDQAEAAIGGLITPLLLSLIHIL